MVVGAQYEDVESDGLSPLKQGVAYFYRFVIDNWQYSDRVTATDPEDNAIFGADVAISGSSAIVGSPWKMESGQSQAGTAHLFQRSGSAYLYNRAAGNTWSLTATLAGEGAAAGDGFGMGVALGEEIAAIGATDPNSSGDSGALYLFK